MTVRFLIVCGGSGVNLLGQRRALGMDAELQIDVGSEVLQQSLDPRSFAIELDRYCDDLDSLFQDALNRVSEVEFSKNSANSDYVNRGIYRQEDINHTRFLAQHSVVNVSLERALFQSPAVGGLAIRHQMNLFALEQVLGRMMWGRELGPENPLEVWIVSSTAGGTGEGVHRFVAACLADFVHNHYADTPLKVNFIRVGQLTYQTVNMQQTALNTFFGVAADAGFTLTATKDFREFVAHWFYVDVPDVGTGTRSVAIRAQTMEMAAKAVMLEELQDDLQRLLVNNGGIPMVLTRTGYWGGDFGEKRKYYETLRQLREKLRELLEPDYEKKYIGGDERQAPRLESGEELEEWTREAGDGEYVLRRMKEGWQFPRYRMQGYPERLEEVREEVTKWKTALSELLRQDLERLRADWMVDRVRKEDDEAHRERVPLRVSTASEVKFGQREWFQRVEEAHEALAWSWALLGCDLPQGTPRRGGRWNRIEELLERARKISRALHGFDPFQRSKTRARRAASELSRFLRTLLEVDLLLRLEEEAHGMLSTELSGVRETLETLNAEFETVRKTINEDAPEFVMAANLSDPLDMTAGDTWLQSLGNVAQRRDREALREEVLRGATGLTEAGLRAVLGVSPEGDMVEICHQLLDLDPQTGRIHNPKGNTCEAKWWAGTPTSGTLSYEYRIFPSLDNSLRGSLCSQAQGLRCVFDEMGVTDLKVLAFQGLSLTRKPGDCSNILTYLLRPFVPIVRRVLSQLEEPDCFRPSSKFHIVSAGVGGEFLCSNALEKAGLREEEIEKIGEFYRFCEKQ